MKAKRIVTWLLAMVMILSVCPVTARAETGSTGWSSSPDDRVWEYQVSEKTRVELEDSDEETSAVLAKYQFLFENRTVDASDYDSEILGHQTEGRAVLARISDEIYGDAQTAKFWDVEQIQAGDILVCQRPWAGTDLWYMAIEDWNEEDQSVSVCLKVDSGLPVWGTKFYPSNWGANFYILTRGREIDGPSEQDVANTIRDFQNLHPGGMVWNSRDYYESPAWGASIECASFAFLLSDYLFGLAEPRELERNKDARPGDVIAFRNRDGAVTHWAVVMTVMNSGVQIAEGNYDGHVKYGRWVSMSELSRCSVYTRYPEPDVAEEAEAALDAA